MGQGWRRVSEAVRQKVGITMDKKFIATTNGRNEAMFREATDFAAHLRTLEKDLKSVHKHIDAYFKNLRNILDSPLPRAYEEGLNGPAPTEDEPKKIGQNVQYENIPLAAEEVKKRIEEEVMVPLRDWMDAYKSVADRMKHLEALRLELDSRRRTVDSLRGKLERVKATLGSNRKAEYELKETEETIAHKTEKMDETHRKFQELERTVYNSLFTIVKDTGVLRDYALGALQIFQNCFQKSVDSFDGRGHTRFSTTAGLYNGMTTAVAGGVPTAAADDKNRGFISQLADKFTKKSAMEAPPVESDNHDQAGYGYGQLPPRAMSMKHEMDPNMQDPYNAYRPAYLPSPTQRYMVPTPAGQPPAAGPSSGWNVHGY